MCLPTSHFPNHKSFPFSIHISLQTLLQGHTIYVCISMPVSSNDDISLSILAYGHIFGDQFPEYNAFLHLIFTKITHFDMHHKIHRGVNTENCVLLAACVLVPEIKRSSHRERVEEPWRKQTSTFSLTLWSTNWYQQVHKHKILQY